MITVLVVPFGCFVLKRNPWLENSDKHLCSPELLTGSSRSCCCAGWVHECCWGQSWLKAPLPVPVPLPVHSAGRKRSHTTSTCHCAFVVCNPASLGSASPPPHIKWWWCKIFKAFKKKNWCKICKIKYRNTEVLTFYAAGPLLSHEPVRGHSHN